MKRYCGSDWGERPFIVAIDGLGGAGKTTFVKELVSMLENACTIHVLHIDDYIVESEKRYNTGYELSSPYSKFTNTFPLFLKFF